MADLVVASKIKGMIKDSGMNCGGTLLDAVDAQVKALIKKAVERAKANGRKTVRDTDV